MSVALGSSAAVLYSQPHNGTGTINLSSWVFENGSDADLYAYDSFIIPTGGAVDRVTWRGGYQYNAMYGSVNNFSIYFYESTAGGTEPHVNNPQLPEFYLARYLLNGIAGEDAKKIQQLIKGSKMKVQAAIQGDAIRVTGAKRDDLQAAMALIKKDIADLPLSFNNFRD